MTALFNKRTFMIIGAISLIGVTLFILVRTFNQKEPNWVTATVERGEVNEIVSVSGFIEAKNTAELAFPTIGKVTEVFVKEGQMVAQGEVLTTLASTIQVAERNSATAQLQIAEAQYKKLIAGESTEVRAIADTSLENAERTLLRTTEEEEEKVASARKILLSNGLTALSQKQNEDATPPTITGSYTCTEEGTYTIEVYNSSSYSGYSYRLTGLETATAQVSTNQPAPLGECGLFIQFTSGDMYAGSIWTIDVPNKRSALYVANENAYALALKQQANAVAEAQDALTLAKRQTAETNAGPRSEEIQEAQANVYKARAAVAQVDAQINDRSVVAPFAGIITDVSIQSGETSPTTPVITLLASDAFELKARIPEIDITKIQVDQQTETVFDAQSQETFYGKVTYVSPLATIIDGVAYFDATITLDTVPSWIRSGLNTDVSIIINKKENVLRIPKRFLIENVDGTHSVYLKNGTQKATSSVEIITLGNNGFVEVSNVQEGQTIVAP